MNRIFTFLFFILFSFNALAQSNLDTSKHLSFKGIPINGTLAEYVTKLKKVGLVQKILKDGVAILEGEFASYKNCTIGVYTLKQKDLVNKVGVLFQNQETWSSLFSNYHNLKEMLTEKYGPPSECVEKFPSYTPDDDGSKMTQVQLGNCKYYTTFETEKGTIQISIENTDLSQSFVKLLYFDKINSDKIKKQALDDL